MAKSVTALIEQAMNTTNDQEALACLKMAKREYRNDGIKLSEQAVVADDRALNIARAELTEAVKQNQTLLDEVADLKSQVMINSTAMATNDAIDDAMKTARKSKRFAIASMVLSVVVIVLIPIL